MIHRYDIEYCLYFILATQGIFLLHKSHFQLSCLKKLNFYLYRSKPPQRIYHIEPRNIDLYMLSYHLPLLSHEPIRLATDLSRRHIRLDMFNGLGELINNFIDSLLSFSSGYCSLFNPENQIYFSNIRFSTYRILHRWFLVVSMR